MAKAAKAKKRAKLTPASDRKVKRGHNNGPDLSAKQREELALTHKQRYEHLLARKKQADADLRNRAKLIRADLGAKGVRLIKAMIRLTTDDGEIEMKSDIAIDLEAAKYMGAAIGAQLELFGPTAEDAITIARGEGRKAGKAGDKASPPYAPGPQHQAWLDGFGEGNAELLKEGIRAPT